MGDRSSLSWPREALAKWLAPTLIRPTPPRMLTEQQKALFCCRQTRKNPRNHVCFPSFVSLPVPRAAVGVRQSDRRGSAALSPRRRISPSGQGESARNPGAVRVPCAVRFRGAGHCQRAHGEGGPHRRRHERSGNFKTFLKAVEAAGLTATLQQAGHRTRCSRPTDTAFSKLPDGHA